MIKQFENFSYYTEISRVEYNSLINNDHIYSFDRNELDKLLPIGFSTVTCKLFNVSNIPFFNDDMDRIKSNFSSIESLKHFPSRDYYTTEIRVDDKLIDCKNKNQVIPNTCLSYNYGQIIYITKLKDEYYLVKFCGNDLYRSRSYNVDDFGYYKCDQLDGLVDCLNKYIPKWS